MSTKFIAKLLGVAMVLSLVVAGAATSHGLTQAELDDYIAQGFTAEWIMANVGGGSSSGGSSSSCYAYTRDLTLGSTGADVVELQTMLVGSGNLVMPAGVSMGYFGPLTQSALASYQAANGIAPAAGYFGPITRGHVAANCSTGSTGSSGSSSSSALSGGAGSVESYTLVSTISNEEVGEDEEDVEVAGLEVEADENSDLELTAVKLAFAQSTGATEDFDHYADEVSVWFDGEEVARVDADKFDDDNSYTSTLSLDSGAVVRAEDTENLVVAVSGINNLDSADAGDAWTVDFTSVRFMDAQGATVSEDPSTGTRSFTFETFATAASAELKIASDDDDINDAHLIDVHATQKTEDVELASFTLEAEGDSDLEIKKFGVNLDVTGAAHVDDFISGGASPAIFLVIEGEEYGTASYFDDGDGVDVGTDEDVLFDDVDYTIDAGDTVSVVVKADILALSGDIDEGDTIAVTLGETETDQTTLVDVEDEAGEQLADIDITGTSSAGAHAAHDIGINVSLVSATATADNNDQAADNDVGTFTMVFDITSYGGSVYVGDTAAGTTVADGSVGVTVTDAIVYRVYDSGTATTDDLADLVTFTTPSGVTDSTDNILINEGKTSRVTLTVTQTNDTAEDDGIYYLDLAGIGWGIADDTTYEYTYVYDLDDFETNTIQLN